MKGYHASKGLFGSNILLNKQIKHIFFSSIKDLILPLSFLFSARGLLLLMRGIDRTCVSKSVCASLKSEMLADRGGPGLGHV